MSTTCYWFISESSRVAQILLRYRLQCLCLCHLRDELCAFPVFTELAPEHISAPWLYQFSSRKFTHYRIAFNSSFAARFCIIRAAYSVHYIYL